MSEGCKDNQREGESASRAGGGLGRPPNQILRDTVNKWAVRNLLECILVVNDFASE